MFSLVVVARSFTISHLGLPFTSGKFFGLPSCIGKVFGLPCVGGERLKFLISNNWVTERKQKLRNLLLLNHPSGVLWISPQMSQWVCFWTHPVRFKGQKYNSTVVTRVAKNENKIDFLIVHDCYKLTAVDAKVYSLSVSVLKLLPHSSKTWGQEQSPTKINEYFTSDQTPILKWWWWLPHCLTVKLWGLGNKPEKCNGNYRRILTTQT